MTTLRGTAEFTPALVVLPALLFEQIGCTALDGRRHCGCCAGSLIIFRNWRFADAFDLRMLAFERHALGLVYFAAAPCDANFFLEHEPLLDHENFLDDGNDHGVALV